jgi:diguanylate cyclase (GGDEF)-like protein/PAS domain S-box-containing protein
MRRRILIVDSSSSDLLLASTVLEIAGYHVQHANDTKLALAVVRDTVPDLILADISLPDRGGLGLIRQLKADLRLRDVPVVGLGALAFEGELEKASDAGYSGFIAKPIDGKEFATQVAAFLPVKADVKTFLIVDDYPAHLELLRLRLEAEGHTVITASNGIEALEVLERERGQVDGIVSDILMPQMDGYSLCLEVRKSESFGGLPVVLYSGTHNSEEDRQLANAAGADGFIEKPAPIQTILDALGAAAGKDRPAPVRVASPEIEAPVLKQYSESLVRKLEEKSAELAQAEARLSGLVEAALDGIITVDERQNVVLFNSAAETMFGCPRAEALGRSLNAFIPTRFHDAHRRQLAVFGASDSAARRIGVRTVWGLRADETEFPIESSFSKMDTSQGQLYTVFLRDITARFQAEQTMARSEAALRQAQQLAKLAHIVTGPQGALEDSAGTLAEFIDVEAGQVPNTIRGWLKIVHPEDREFLRARALHAARTCVRTEAEYRLRRGEDWMHIYHVMDPLPAPHNGTAQQISWFHTLQDISDRKEATFRILRQNRVLSVLSAINALIVRSIDRDELLREACRIAVQAGQFPKAWIGLIDGESKELRLAAGYGASEAFYESVRLMLREDLAEARSFVATALKELEPVVANDLYREQRTLGDALATGSRAVAVLPLIIDGDGAGVFAIHAEAAGFFDAEEMTLLRELAADISFALAHLRKSEQLQYLANYDPVTGLPNRGLFSERLSLALKKQSGDDGILAVVLIDLDRFRRINETLGRATGDELLQLVARRVQLANASAARIGGDVFAVELRAKDSVTEIARAFEDLSARCFSEPFNASGEELRLGCRGGIAIFPGDGADAETLLRNAEAALRRAKSTSEHSAFYAPDLNARAAEAMSMENRLRRAIEREEFILYYQPKIALSNHLICGVEALIRWQDREGSMVLPGHFIPILEESGLIGTVGEWALRRALLDQKRWRDAGLPAPRVAVNVSATQLRKKDFAETIGNIVVAIKGAALELEITESMIMEQVDRSIAALKSIRAMGVSVAIDDFGTGYCSLSYVAKLPVNSLKIDRSFIVGMTELPVGMAIVSSIIALAHSLELKVVAEGVETAEQERQLQLLACDEAQGFLYSRPIPFDAIAALLDVGKLPARKS